MPKAKPKRACNGRSSQTGKPCKKPPIKGGFVCMTHGGAAPQVRKAADQRIKTMLEQALDPDRSLVEMARVAFSDIRELFDEKGNFLPIKQWPEDIARAVAGVEVVKKNVTSGDGKVDDVLKVKLWDKGRSLENALKKHGHLTDKVEVSITGLEERIKAAQARLDGK
jgi:phage terminase small subunit